MSKLTSLMGIMRKPQCLHSNESLVVNAGRVSVTRDEMKKLFALELGSKSEAGNKKSWSFNSQDRK